MNDIDSRDEFQQFNGSLQGGSKSQPLLIHQ